MDAANAMLPTYVTTCLYFGGLFITFDKIPEGWYWFSYPLPPLLVGAQMLNQYQNPVGQHGGLYDTSYKNQTECITAPLPSVTYDQAGAPSVVVKETEICRHDIDGKVVTVLEFYGMGKEGELMGSIGGCIAMSAALTLLFAICGAMAVSFVRFNRR